MKSLVELANEIDSVLQEFDAEWKKSQVKWFLERKEAVKTWKQTEEAQKLRRTNNWAYYEQLFALSGGKGNYDSDLTSFSRKLDRTIQARNEKIAAKILAAGDDSSVVESGEIVKTNDGFNGLFKLLTSAGSRLIKITTIFAGGYNIQCAHLRTLVQVK